MADSSARNLNYQQSQHCSYQALETAPSRFDQDAPRYIALQHSACRGSIDDRNCLLNQRYLCNWYKPGNTSNQ